MILSQPSTSELAEIVAQRFEKSMRVPQAFFTAESPRIAQACWAMARRFHQGGRLFAFGMGSSATDAQHVSVEFVHPVIVGKRALPTLALTNDAATVSGFVERDKEQIFARQIQLLAQPQDMAMAFWYAPNCAEVLKGIAQAKQLGLLTLGFSGESGGSPATSDLDFHFVAPDSDPFVIQETHETLYHVLWELVHVFFEHEGLLQ